MAPGGVGGGVLVAPKSTSDVACCASSPQSSAPTSVFTTYWMIVPPPGEPVPITNSPMLPSAFFLNTSVGAIVLRGRLPGATRLANFTFGVTEVSIGLSAKSVSWLFSRKPCVMWNEPMLPSTVVVITTTLPCLSTTVKCVVPCSSVLSMPSGTSPRSPALARFMLFVRLMRLARPCR
ncbi:hypothetical protein D3C87_1337580 [compost metagenome]